MVPHRAVDPTGSSRLELVQRFLMSLELRDAAAASVGISAGTTYHVPGTSPLAGTFRGRHEIVTNFRRVFELTSSSDVVKWVDWMVGTNLVSVLAHVHLQSGLIQYQAQLLFLFSFIPSGTIDRIRLFPEDQALFDQFAAQLPAGAEVTTEG